ESPVHPVMEGDNVTLSCRTKQMSSNFIAEFYKDGLSIGKSSTGIISNLNLSRFSDGFYKCSISDVGESPENWLSVRVFAQIVPSRLQLFEHSALYINCEGFNTSTGWTVLRKTKGKVSTCVSGWSSICTIKPAFLSDSGEYWCEGGGERSNAVNITITDGAVILESPVLPVMEGGNVTLRCQTKMTSSAHTADFFKDGRHIGTSTTEEMIIGRVSTSDEGLYSCSISEFGESPQSWLTVRGETSRRVILTIPEVKIKAVYQIIVGQVCKCHRMDTNRKETTQ
uniref:Ig-like domain-containing protein n=1 Tax=Acanthochromis polyacanthus TaxID=80966 RepID=A0A3Q1GYC7_9TELE